MRDTVRTTLIPCSLCSPQSGLKLSWPGHPRRRRECGVWPPKWASRGISRSCERRSDMTCSCCRRSRFFPSTRPGGCCSSGTPEGPAPPVDDDQMVVRAQQDAVLEAGVVAWSPVVVPLLPAPGVLRPHRRRQRLHYRGDYRRAFWRQITVQHSGAIEGSLHRYPPVLERLVRAVVVGVGSGQPGAGSRPGRPRRSAACPRTPCGSARARRRRGSAPGSSRTSSRRPWSLCPRRPSRPVF